MDLFSRSLDLFVHVAFWTVVHSLWQATAFAASLALWRRFTDERDHAARSAAAALTLLFLAVAPLVTATSLTLNYRPTSLPELSSAPFSDADFAALDVALGDLEGASTSAPSTWFSLSLDDVLAFLPKAIALLWALGALWGALRLVRSAVRLHLVGGRSASASEDLLSRCRTLAARCGLSRAPRLLYSATARGPYAFGLLRPCIVLPAAWALETSPDVLEAAIAHELAHLKRRDLWILALQRFVETTLFFHPAVWYVSRTLEAERERDADRRAAAALGDPGRYAESLCRLASMVDSPGSPALTVPFHGETRMKLLERVRHVLRTEEAGSGAMTSVGWLCIAPALLVAIFFGQTAFVGSLRADDEPQQPAAEERTPDVVDQEKAAIDALILQNLEAQHGASEDYVALRRIFLDASGTLPTAEQAADFAADDSPGKYDRIVRDLMTIIAEQRDEDAQGRDDEGREEEEEEEDEDEDEEDEDEEGDDDDERATGEADAQAFQLQLSRDKDALARQLRQEVERIETQYRERMGQLQEEMAKAQAELQALAQRRAAELEARHAEIVQAHAAMRGQQAERERHERLDERADLPGEDADDLTPRERRMLGVIRALEARLRAVEGREPGANRRDGEGDDVRPGQRREAEERRYGEERREGDRREEGDRPGADERREGDRERGEPREQEREAAARNALREREAAERQAREAGERQGAAEAVLDTQRSPRSEEEHLEQQRNHFAERLYYALRGEDILQERKAEFARRAVLDVLGFELNEEQVKVVLERAGGEFDGFRQLVARLAAAGQGEARER